jgi:hypothetical protein
LIEIEIRRTYPSNIMFLLTFEGEIDEKRIVFDQYKNTGKVCVLAGTACTMRKYSRELFTESLSIPQMFVGVYRMSGNARIKTLTIIEHTVVPNAS